MKDFIQKTILLTLLVTVTINSFSQWSKANSNVTENLKNIFFINNTTGYCVGGGDVNGLPLEKGVILKTTDGGNNWSTMFQQDSLLLSEIAVVNSKIYAYGTKNSSFYSVTYDPISSTWTDSVIHYNPTNIIVYNSEIYFVNSLDYSLQKIRNDSIFNVVNSTSLLGDVSIFDVNDSGIIYVNSQINQLYKSRDFGLNWDTTFSFPSSFDFLNKVNSKIKLFGDTIVIKGTMQESINYSTNNGMTWQYNQGNLNVNVIVAKSDIISSNTTYLVDRFGKVFFTKNYGVSWIGQDTLDGRSFQNIKFITNKIGFIIGDSGVIYKTINGGVGIKEINIFSNHLSVFPNPASNFISFETSSNTIIKSIKLYDNIGQLVKSFELNKKTLNIKNINAGLYILLFETNKGNISKKILIK